MSEYGYFHLEGKEIPGKRRREAGKIFSIVGLLPYHESYEAASTFPERPVNSSFGFRFVSQILMFEK